MRTSADDTRYGYPTQYDLEQTLMEFCSRDFVRGFAQQRGIVLASANQSEMAAFLSDLLYDQRDLETIREAAFRASGQSTLVGFMVNASDEDFDLGCFLDRFRNQIVDRKKEMQLLPITDSTSAGVTQHHGSVTYTDRRPGRIEFLQATKRSFEYTVSPVSNTQWRVLVDCDRSNDARVMEDWLKKELRREPECTVETMDQDNLSPAQTIQFFDRLAREGLGEGWSFVRVSRLVLRSPATAKTGRGEEEEEIEGEAPQLALLSRAILEGESLRDHPLVRQFEGGGYCFTAMSCVYDSREHAQVVTTRAEFKERPKVFEVALEKYQKRSGLTEELIDAEPVAGSKHMIATYWRHAKIVYDELTQD